MQPKIHSRSRNFASLPSEAPVLGKVLYVDVASTHDAIDVFRHAIFDGRWVEVAPIGDDRWRVTLKDEPGAAGVLQEALKASR